LAAVTAQGVGIGGAFVKIVEWPQYNATTAPDGTYSINGVPYDSPGGSTYTLRASADGYGSNSSIVTLTPGNPNPAVNWELYPSDPRYIPFLNDQGNYNSSIQIFNPFGFNTTEDITTYNLLGGIASDAFEIPVNKLGSKYPNKIASANFVGSAMINNTRPESIVQGYIKTISTNIYSIAPSVKMSSAMIQYIPMLNDRGTSYDSGIQIFNPYNNDITATLTGYNLLTGTETTLPPFNIPAKTLGSRYAEQVVGGDFVGTVKVETSQPALVQGNVRTLATGTASIASATVITSTKVQYIPFLNDRGTTYDSGIQIFNPYDTNITVNLTGYNLLTGTETTLPPFNITARTLGSRYAEQVVGGDFIGTIKVETSEPAIVQGNIRTLATGTASIAPATVLSSATVQYIPFLNDVGTTYDSGIQIFNPYDTDITATLTGYNLLTGTETTLPSFTIPAKTLGSKYAEQVVGGDFVGTIKVETSQPALVQGNIRTLASMTVSIAPASILQ
jgi:hypothetical protein